MGVKKSLRNFNIEHKNFIPIRIFYICFNRWHAFYFKYQNSNHIKYAVMICKLKKCSTFSKFHLFTQQSTYAIDFDDWFKLKCLSFYIHSLIVYLNEIQKCYGKSKPIKNMLSIVSYHNTEKHERMMMIWFVLNTIWINNCMSIWIFI